MLHPSVKILCLIALAIALHLSNAWQLLGISVLLCVALIYNRATGFWKLLRRVRWLLVSLLLIFAFNTPGEYFRSWPFDLAPTYEGLLAGLLQSAKICMMLAGLALLLATTNRESLITGFYLLASPLRVLKIDPERFAARLWLTLHYVEQAPKTGRSATNLPADGVRNNIFDHLTAALPVDGEQENNGPQHIQLKTRKLARCDLMVLAALLGGGIYLLCA